MPPTWTEIEKAIFDWVVASSGLPTSRVLWWGQKKPSTPTKPYISLRVRLIQNPGRDWVDHEDAESPTPGAELTFRQRGSRMLRLQLTCFSDNPTDASAATAKLDDVQSSCQLPSIAEAFAEAGVGIGSFEDIISIDGLVNTTILEARATMTVLLHIAKEVSGTGTYIETVELEGTIS